MRTLFTMLAALVLLFCMFTGVQAVTPNVTSTIAITAPGHGYQTTSVKRHHHHHHHTP